MKYCVVELDLTQNPDPTIGRVTGPYDLKSAMAMAERLANEATQADSDSRETRELDALDLMEVIGDVAGVYGSVDTSDEEPACLYFVKELYQL